MMKVGTKLSIEVMPDVEKGMGECAVSIEGSGSDLMCAWGYLTNTLAQTLGIPAAALLALGALSEKDVRDSVTECISIDLNALKKP